MSSPWLMSGTTSFTPAARSAATAGESNCSSSIATAPEPAWKYARIGSFGAMSIGAVSRARPRAVVAFVVGTGAAAPRPVTRRNVRVSVSITAPFYLACVLDPLRGFPEPEAHVCRAHRRPDRGGELRADRIEVDLAGEACGECIEGASRVVARAVEASIHPRLH